SLHDYSPSELTGKEASSSVSATAPAHADLPVLVDPVDKIGPVANTEVAPLAPHIHIFLGRDDGIGQYYVDDYYIKALQSEGRDQTGLPMEQIHEISPYDDIAIDRLMKQDKDFNKSYSACKTPEDQAALITALRDKAQEARHVALEAAINNG